MTRKHWVATNLVNQAKEEDFTTAGRMYQVANHLRKCGSTTIWDVAMGNYKQRVSKGIETKKPEIDEFLDFRGEDSDAGRLACLGLARCKRVQCPVCCYARTILRRRLALEWAREADWSGYYGAMLTFTVSHHLSDSETSERFGTVLERLCLSQSRFSSWFRLRSTQVCTGYKSPDPGSLGYISSLEFTFGKNGLHPHFHTIFLSRCESDLENLRMFFRKDRVRVWKESGGSLLRMPDFNEDESFKIFLRPGEETARDKVVSYVSKSLFETLSSATKDTQKEETSKSIFQLTGHELKYFCTFFEATSGKRFYRAGGVCKAITSVKEALVKDQVEEEIKASLKSIFKLSASENGIPEGWISEFVGANRKEFGSVLPQLSADGIKRLLAGKWDAFITMKTSKFRLSCG
jgi:hypothetical protein